MIKQTGFNTSKVYNFCDDNHLIKPSVYQPSLLSQIAIVNKVELNSELSIRSDINFNQESFDQENLDLLTALLGIEAKKNKLVSKLVNQMLQNKLYYLMRFLITCI